MPAGFAADHPITERYTRQLGMKADLNCDLGEGEPMARTEALFRIITSANVACGGHAGSRETMTQCVGLAKENGVRLGAHPGLPGAFGRESAALEPDELARMLFEQVGALEKIAGENGVTLHHLKLHGALYHATEASEALARVLVSITQCEWPDCCLYALAGGRLVRLARENGVAVREEAFLDRGYLPNGTLVPRGLAGSLLTVAQVGERLRHWARNRRILATDGTPLAIQPETWCVHGDGPEAWDIAGLAREFLD